MTISKVDVMTTIAIHVHVVRNAGREVPHFLKQELQVLYTHSGSSLAIITYNLIGSYYMYIA